MIILPFCYSTTVIRKSKKKKFPDKWTYKLGYISRIRSTNEFEDISKYNRRTDGITYMLHKSNSWSSKSFYRNVQEITLLLEVCRKITDRRTASRTTRVIHKNAFNQISWQFNVLLSPFMDSNYTLGKAACRITHVLTIMFLGSQMNLEIGGYRIVEKQVYMHVIWYSCSSLMVFILRYMSPLCTADTND